MFQVHFFVCQRLYGEAETRTILIEMLMEKRNVYKGRAFEPNEISTYVMNVKNKHLKFVIELK